MAFPEPFFPRRPHPWHGLEPGADAPEIVTAFIEISPFDFDKCDVQKPIGCLKLDRPQRGSSSPPTLSGLVPETCANRVAAISTEVARAEGDQVPESCGHAHATGVVAAAMGDYNEHYGG